MKENNRFCSYALGSTWSLEYQSISLTSIIKDAVTDKVLYSSVILHVIFFLYQFLGQGQTSIFI